MEVVSAIQFNGGGVSRKEMELALQGLKRDIIVDMETRFVTKDDLKGLEERLVEAIKGERVVVG